MKSRVVRAAQTVGLPVVRSPRSLRQIIIGFLMVGLMAPSLVDAAALSSASVALSDPRPSQTGVSYNFNAGSFSGGTVKCVKEVFATSASGSTKPTGMVTATGITIDVSQTLLSSTSGWTRGGADADGTVTFTNASSAEAPSGSKSWVLTGFTNSSVADTTYYVRFNTYGNTDCATSPLDDSVVAFTVTNGSTVSFTVDPTLSFSVAGVAGATGCDGTTTTAASTSTTLPFGTVSAAANAVTCQDLVAATNGSGGYTVYLRYTGQPSNGTATIADHTGTNAAPTAFSAAGTDAYGYTTDSSTLGTGTPNRFTSGGQKWAAATTTNAEVGFTSAPSSSTTYRIGHQVGVATTTLAGTYQTTIIYTCTPIY